jgi:hypothetical protein
MIKNDAELMQTLEQLQRMYRALADLRQEVLPKNPRTFALMAEGPLDHIRRLQDGIDAYVGAAQVEEHEGDLREIDLDDSSFILRNAGETEQILCSIDGDLLETAKEALDHRVRVTGERPIRPGTRQADKLRVTKLVVVDAGKEQ